jgi:hypothetical protein
MKNNFILFISLSILTLINLQGNAQGWENTFGGSVEDNAYSAIQTLDGGYALLGFSESTSSVGTNVIFIKTDANGQEQWRESFGGIGDDKGYEVVQNSDGTYIIVGQTSSMGNGEDDVLLIKVGTEGKELWRKAYGGAFNDRGFSITIAKDGGYILTGRTELINNESANVLLIRTDSSGNIIWEKNFGGDNIDVGESVIETSEGDIIVVGQTKSFATPNPASPNAPSADVYFIKTNAAGETLVEETYGNLEQDIAFDVLETAQGNFALTGVTTNNSDVYLLMLDKEGKELWSKSYGGIFDEIGYSITQAADGGFAIAGFKTVTPTSSQVYIIKTDNQGTLEWERLFGSSSGQDIGRSIATTSDGGYIIAGNYDVNTDPNSLLPLYDMYLIKTNKQGNIFQNIIQGTVHRDLNTNCEKDAGEKILKDWLVRLRKGEEVFYATTDDNGNYSISVENGNYNVGLIVLNSAWEVCQNYNISFTEPDTMQLNFATRSTVENCPVLVVDVSTAVLEPCKSTNYTINICNRGIEAAQNTYVDVQFDDYLTVNFSTLPWTNHVGNIYRFDIGDLLIEECGAFEVNVTLSCDAIIGQAHCVEAYAHPDPICVPPPPLWDGASIKVEGDCIGDSVRFIIKNIGNGNILSPLSFIVVQDEILYRNFSGTIELTSQEADTLYIPATSVTYRVIAEQPPGHPYGETASAAVEGCPFGQPFNTGFLTAFSNADALPFYSVDCRENKLIAGRADMTPSPKGVGTDHKITNKDDLEFHIYFQNTGSDTVKQVIIKDTISSALDISTLVPGASSHPYDFEVSGTGVLILTFSNINLLPKSLDADHSFGFVKFKISQKTDNPAGMTIDNQATIHFDLGAPFLSNPTFHTIGGETIEEFIEIMTDVENVYVPNLEVKIMPNPFDAQTGTIIELIGLSNNQRIQFSLFDVAGRIVDQQQFDRPKFEFYPKQLPQGMYIYTIEAAGGLVNSGKVFIK